MEPNSLDFRIISRVLRVEFRPYWRLAWLAALFMVIAALASAAPVIIVKRVIDDIFINANFLLVIPIALAVLAVYFTKGASSYIYNVLLTRISANIAADMRIKGIGKLIRQDVPFFDRMETSELINRLANATQLAAELVRSILAIAIRDLLTVIALISVMIYYNWVLTISLGLIAPLAIWAVAAISKRVRRFVGSEFADISSLIGLLTERFSGIRLIKSYRIEEPSLEIFGRNINDLRKRAISIGKASALSSPLMETLGGVAVALMIVYAGWAAQHGISSAGELFAIITGFLTAYDPLKSLVDLRVRLARFTTPLALYYELVDQDIRQRQGSEDFTDAHGDMSFANVGFAYAGGHEALRKLSFTAKSGEITAIVGRSGAGKSTIFSLLQRFYDAGSGEIKIGKQNINDIRIDELRARIALIPQESVIFSGSIYENIALARPDAPREEIMEAAREAHMDEFVEGLEAGYDTKIGEGGADLSGGQRQRLSIARAFLKDAPILLLDEATSALDSASERVIQDALGRLARDKTVLVIAHRLSTIRNADRIVVINDGAAVESGNHDELVKKDGIYHALYQLQFEREESANGSEG